MNEVRAKFDLENKDRKILIDWDPIQDVDGYNIYGSPVPYRKTKLNTELITGNTFSVIPPLIPDASFFFWVSSVKNSTETFINEDGIEAGLEDFSKGIEIGSIGEEFFDEDYMQFAMDLIREREIAELQNLGEEVILYKRRYSGITCDCVQAEAGSGYARCPKCFGTAIVGGYYPSIKILVRYRGLPKRKIDFLKGGLTIGHEFDSWTLWTPPLRENDFYVRANGECFSVQGPEMSRLRGGRKGHQEWKSVLIQPTDIRLEVTDEKINKALEEQPSSTKQYAWELWS